MDKLVNEPVASRFVKTPELPKVDLKQKTTNVLNRINSVLDTAHGKVAKGKGAYATSAALVAIAAGPAAASHYELMTPENLTMYANILAPFTGALIGLTFEPLTKLQNMLQGKEIKNREQNYTPLKDVVAGALLMGGVGIGATTLAGPELASIIMGADDMGVLSFAFMNLLTKNLGKIMG
jgi:hypothetical protein